MNKIKKMIAALLMTGLIAGCTPLTTGTGATDGTGAGTSATAGETQSGTATQAGTDTAGAGTQAGADTQPAASTTPVVTMPVDLTIILAEGDGIEVTSGDVEDEFNRMLDAFRAQYGAANVDGSIGMLQGQKAGILDQLVRNAIFDRKADEFGLEVESEEAVAEYDKLVADNTASYGSAEAFEEAVAGIGYTMEAYRKEILSAFRYQALAERVTEDVTVSQEEIQTSYDETKAEQFSQKPGATIYHIFFGTPDDTEAEATAKEAKTKLDGGAAFSDIAQEYGQDGSASSGGLLGSYPYDTQELGADFMAEAAKLSEGEISQPVLTSFGWHIIMVENVQTDAKTFGLEESIPMNDGSTRTVSEVVESSLLTAKKNERMIELEEEWKNEYNVTVYPDRIPMNVVEENDGGDSSTQGTTTQGTESTQGTTQP